jgi:hypothetical protein
VVRRTLATFRSAELGFLGVDVYTRVQTPLFWGALFKAGVAFFFSTRLRPLRTSWLIVGMVIPLIVQLHQFSSRTETGYVYFAI